VTSEPRVAWQLRQLAAIRRASSRVGIFAVDRLAGLLLVIYGSQLLTVAVFHQKAHADVLDRPGCRETARRHSVER
jgi:hypothetical protein